MAAGHEYMVADFDTMTTALPASPSLGRLVAGNKLRLGRVKGECWFKACQKWTRQSLLCGTIVHGGEGRKRILS